MPTETNSVTSENGIPILITTRTEPPYYSSETDSWIQSVTEVGMDLFTLCEWLTVAACPCDALSLGQCGHIHMNLCRRSFNSI